MNMDEPDVVLVDDEGLEHRFFLYDVIEIDERSYALLQPEGDDGELVVLRFEGAPDSGTLTTISDEEWEMVEAALLESEQFEVDDD